MRTCALALLKVDYLTIDADLATVSHCATSEFAADYRATVARERPQITQNQIRTTVAVSTVAATSLGATTSQIMIAADTMTTTSTSSPVSRSNRFSATLRLVSGSWLVASVSTVP
ncbi:hypothetical protein [Fodinicola feengrottensis]|nr:hypothetical protein [Fodinicola feengrottensis]